MARVRIELRLGFGVRAAIITEPETILMVTVLVMPVMII